MIEVNISDLANEDHDTLRAVAALITLITDGDRRTIKSNGCKTELSIIPEMFMEEELKPVETVDPFLEHAAQIFNAPVEPKVLPPPVNNEITENVEFEGTGYPGQTLDSAGQPWDANIHSRGKSTTKDGRWRSKREEKNTKSVSPVTAPPAAGIPPVTPPPTLAAPQAEFQAIMKKTTELMAAKKLTREKVTEILNNFGIPSLTIIATTPYLHLIPAVSAAFDQAAIS